MFTCSSTEMAQVVQRLRGMQEVAGSNPNKHVFI